MIKLGEILILDNDSPNEPQPQIQKSTCIITCGLSYKSTITASSIDDDGFTYCIQRSIFTLNKVKIEPQEFKIYWAKKPKNIYHHLEIVTTLLICDTPIFAFEKFVF
ncbi:MAG: hypothetical protein RSA27_08530 [Oscillospiraceae bacterium]